MTEKKLTETAVSPRAGRRGRKPRSEHQPTDTNTTKPPVWPGMAGGHYSPLAENNLPLMHEAILELLKSTGLSEPTQSMIDRVTAEGGRYTDDGRLTFPTALVERALAGFQKGFTLHGQTSGHEMILSGKNVHLGSGGASPNIVDLDSGRYR